MVQDAPHQLEAFLSVLLGIHPAEADDVQGGGATALVICWVRPHCGFVSAIHSLF